MPYRLDGADMMQCGRDKYLQVLVPSTHSSATYGKRPAGRSALLHVLEEAVPFVLQHITSSKGCNTILLHSFEGLEIPVCVCISVLSQYFDYSGNLLSSPREIISKSDISKFYQFVQKYFPQSLPSRAMRNVVNEYLMSKYKSKQ